MILRTFQACILFDRNRVEMAARPAEGTGAAGIIRIPRQTIGFMQ
jgi:hypothetical protein